MATVESEITADMLTKRRGHFIKVKGAIVGGLTRCFSSSPKGLLLSYNCCGKSGILFIVFSSILNLYLREYKGAD